MRVLIDTNIFICREDYTVIPDNIQELMRILNKLKVQILIHNLSREEIKRDKNQQRKQIISSKIGTYLTLEAPPSPEDDQQFLNVVGMPSDFRELVDNNLLYCVYRDAVDFLISEDKGIHRKSGKLGISGRVFNSEEALVYFNRQFLDIRIPSVPALKQLPVHNLDIKDPIFSSVKEEYPEFEQWWKKISREGRYAWVYFKDDGYLGAILIPKIENEAIDSDPPLPAKNRVKISTIKVSSTGYKIGELFVKMSIEFAIRNDIHEIYLTHFTRPQDDLVNLIEDFGFYKIAKKNGEDIFIKKLVPDEDLELPIEIAKRFYPSFYDGRKVRKFIVPIRPEYHNKLFTESQWRQPFLFEYREPIIEGNTIKKAYLCHSKIRKLSKGDILLFYRSIDEKKLTSLGVIERLYNDVKDPDTILRYVGKRTVYTRSEVEEIAKKPTKIILFKWHFHFENRLALSYLLGNNILSGPPQSIVEISHEKYQKIKNAGGIREHFTVN